MASAAIFERREAGGAPVVLTYVATSREPAFLFGTNPVKFVAANRHPGQVGYSHSPPQEVRDEESSLRSDPGKEGESQVAQVAACTALERQR